MNITKALNFNVKKQTVNSKSVLVDIHTIPINVRKIYTDVDGVIIAKGAAPAAMQVQFPVFLLNEFDRQGGYLIGRKAVPPIPGTYFYQCFVNGNGANSFSVTGVTGINEIQGQLQFGDVVLVYTDSLNAPSCFVWIVINSNPVSMASILSNSATTQNDKRLGRLSVFEINFMPSDSTQNSQDLNIVRNDNIGNFNQNQVQPLGIYKSIMDKQQNLITLKLIFDINQFIGISFYMLYACDTVRFELKTRIK